MDERTTVLYVDDNPKSSRLLARQLAVSRNTVSAVIDQLAAEGYLDIARGRRPSIAAGLARPPASFHQWGGAR